MSLIRLIKNFPEGESAESKDDLSTKWSVDAYNTWRFASTLLTILLRAVLKKMMLNPVSLNFTDRQRIDKNVLNCKVIRISKFNLHQISIRRLFLHPFPSCHINEKYEWYLLTPSILFSHNILSSSTQVNVLLFYINIHTISCVSI
jgi:hypothetical protein